MSKLKDNGDLLERLNHQFIEEFLPNYELVWEKFVAVNFNINDENEKIKQQISEYNYSCLESAICMQSIRDKDYINLFEQEGLTESELLKNYLSFINDFLVFEAHMGRIFETLERTWALLKMKKNEDLLEFYHHRHNVIHSHKLPLQFNVNSIGIPELKAQGEENGWSDKEKLTWGDFLSDSKHIQVLDDYFIETCKKLFEALNISFGAVMSNLKDLIIDWDILNSDIVNPNFDPFSGTTMSMNYEFKNVICDD